MSLAFHVLADFRSFVPHNHHHSLATCHDAHWACLHHDACRDCLADVSDWPFAAVAAVDLLSVAYGRNVCERHDPMAERLWETLVSECHEPEKTLDCSVLTSCQWEGMHPPFLGDGVCQDYECYNTAVCDYDGGDCERPEEDEPQRTKESCSYHQLILHESLWGTWGPAFVRVSDDQGRVVVEADEATSVCLHLSSQKCYQIEASGGSWGNPVQWELQDPSGLVVASGSTPASCSVGCGADTMCATDVIDPSHRDFKDLHHCITRECPTVWALCREDEACQQCLEESPEESCYENALFSGLVECSLCRCGDESLCPTRHDTCDAQGLATGSKAMLEFATCTGLDARKVAASSMAKAFSTLDAFQECAALYASQESGEAYECWRIFEDAMDNTDGDLARLIYQDPERLYHCATKASHHTPLCPVYNHFQTLLFETLGTLEAIEQINCGAWQIYQRSCARNLMHAFQVIDFTEPAQCAYILQHDCGDLGAVPVFRRNDCSRQISNAAWDFYHVFAQHCLTPSLSRGDESVDSKKPYAPYDRRTSDKWTFPWTRTIGFVVAMASATLFVYQSRRRLDEIHIKRQRSDYYMDLARDVEGLSLVSLSSSSSTDDDAAF